MRFSTLAFIFYTLFLIVGQPRDNQVVQFNINSILNARPVTTLTGNKLVSWTRGIDGNGIGDGYLTQSAAFFNGDKNAHALPDNPLIPANTSHPEILLHYSNSDSLHSQACSISGSGEVGFRVQQAKYRAIYLALTSAEGASELIIHLNYTNGTEIKESVLPDYYQDIKPGDAGFCYLVHDLAKWGNKNNMTEKNHHNIDLLKIEPDAKRILKSIQIGKTKPGYVVLWAAAGVKAG